MSVYKEGYHAVDLISKRSVRIFEDACDFGAPTKVGDELWNWVKQLMEWYGNRETRKEERYSTGYSVTQEVELMDEWAVSDGRKTEKQAIDRFRVDFVSCTKGACKGYDGYLTVQKL